VTCAGAVSALLVVLAGCAGQSPRAKADTVARAEALAACRAIKAYQVATSPTDASSDLNSAAGEAAAAAHQDHAYTPLAGVTYELFAARQQFAEVPELFQTTLKSQCLTLNVSLRTVGPQ
jgi:hypothetical protein